MKKIIAILILMGPLFGSSQVVHDYLFTTLNSTVMLHDSTTTNFMGFGRYNTGLPLKMTLPGPLLRYSAGDSVMLHYRNDAIDKHTIHLHGLDVDQANDGVPFTSFSIKGGDSATYSFRSNDPGVYLYHCHVGTVFHLPMGMYGLLVIDYPGNLLYAAGPGYNKEYDYLSSDMDRSWNDNPTSPGLLNEYDPDYFFINGLSRHQLFADTSQIIFADSGDSVLLRLANIGYTTIEYCFPAGINATAHMSDGRILPNSVMVDTLLIYPGERYSLLLRPTTFINDSIIVNVYSMVNGKWLGTNHIGINKASVSLQISGQIGNGWKVYPIPFTDVISIERPGSQLETITLCGISGREIQRFELIGPLCTLPFEGILPGIYILKTETGLSWRIIKR